MKNTALNIIIFMLFNFSIFKATMCKGQPSNPGTYTLIIEGFDWGPAVRKVILKLDHEISNVQPVHFEAWAKRRSPCVDLSGPSASGKRFVNFAYVSNAKGNRVEKGKYVTLWLQIGPDSPLGSPIQYSNNGSCSGNHWIDYQLVITNKNTLQVWNKETDRMIPLVDQFDLTGKFTDAAGLTLSYASYSPQTETGKRPLIIWLHGGGEGGSDPSIPLIANRAANYAAEEIQSIFGGAFVLVPQCPGAWMHNKNGISTRGRENDIYNKSLMALIKNYVDNHPDIDRDRIYLGGCSNGGYMTLKLMLLYPDFFAAGFPSALAYNSVYLEAQQIANIKDLPIWFVHAHDDDVTPAVETALPVYQRLKKAGAQNIYLSCYDHVMDITGFFGGKDYYYSGHWSWIYSHANHAKLDYDGSPVLVDGQPVTIMEWLASQKRR